MRKDMKKIISVVIPVHNEQGNLEWHHKKIVDNLNKQNIDFEFIYVDDGSTDNSLQVIRNLSRDNNNVRYIALSRNFGKEAALSAGLRKASGDAVLTLDSDGQHPIGIVDQFIKKWNEGFDVVAGVRESNQGEGFIKSIGSKLFYRILSLVDNNQEITPGSTDFRLIDRKVIDEYNKLPEHDRIVRNLIDWLGYKHANIPFNANARHSGKASYSYSKLIKLAIDGTIKHSTRPLKFIGILGILTSMLSLLLMIVMIIETILMSDPMNLAVTGTAFLAVFLSFLVGVVLACQGLLALYIENIFHETQDRPLYIIKEEK